MSKMTSVTTFERVRSIIAKELLLEPDEITIEANLRGEQLRADSLDLVNLVMAFAREFGVEMKDKDFQHVTTVGDLVNYLER
jgi:acyl carrier protein